MGLTGNASDFTPVCHPCLTLRPLCGNQHPQRFQASFSSPRANVWCRTRGSCATDQRHENRPLLRRRFSGNALFVPAPPPPPHLRLPLQRTLIPHPLDHSYLPSTSRRQPEVRPAPTTPGPRPSHAPLYEDGTNSECLHVHRRPWLHQPVQLRLTIFAEARWNCCFGCDSQTVFLMSASSETT